jgi:hypothetical protein
MWGQISPQLESGRHKVSLTMRKGACRSVGLGDTSVRWTAQHSCRERWTNPTSSTQKQRFALLGVGGGALLAILEP